MTGICGWSSDQLGDEALEEVKNIARKLPGAAATVERNVVAGDRMIFAVSNSNRLCGVSKVGAVISAISGIYHWLDKDLQGKLKSADPAEVLISAYQKYGEEVACWLSGSFKFAIGDDQTGQVLLAVDAFCSKQIAYFETSNSLVFASSVNALRSHRLCPSDVSATAIYSYLYFHNVPLPISMIDGVSRLLPGHLLAWDSRIATAKRYAKLTFDEVYDDRDERDLETEILRLLESEVIALSDGVKTGAFLSGGLDSSTLTGLLARAKGECDSFSIGFDAENYDEMEFARNVAKHFGSKHFTYYVTPDDVLNAIPDIAACYSEPFGNASAVPTYYCGKLARENGVERLLGGDGGDELFGGNERYAYDRFFSYYLRIPGFVRTMLEAGLLTTTGEARTLFSKASNYVRKATTPLPDRLYMDTLLSTLGPETVFTQEFMARNDTNVPLDMIRQQYLVPNTESSLNRHLALDWFFTLSCSDLPKVSTMAGLAGIDVAYPFLSNSVVDFSSHLPDRLKVNRHQLRYFYKRAVGEFLPDMTINKSKQGFGLPFGVWLANNDRLRSFAFDSLQSLKGRHIVDSKFIDDLINKLHPVHPQYYGVMVWVLLMLEQYFQAHLPAYKV